MTPTLPSTTRRPRKPDRRGNVLTIRLTREAYDAVTAAADGAGMSVNGWCVAVLVAKANRKAN